MSRKGFSLSCIIINILMILVSASTLLPFLLALVVSFSDERSVLLKGYTFTPDYLTLEAYKFVLSDKLIYNAYAVTIFVTVVGTTISVFICSMAGYAMSVQKLKHRNKFAMYFYIPMVFQVSLVPWYLVISQVFMLKNTILALILPILVSPFNLFLVRNYFKSIPASMAESAEIDGATPFTTFVKIMLPLAKPIIATITLFISLRYWNDYVLALWFVEKKEIQPVQFILFKIRSLVQYMQSNRHRGSQNIPSETVQMATLFVTIGPIILLYPFLQKYFIKGIMIGAVKG